MTLPTPTRIVGATIVLVLLLLSPQTVQSTPTCSVCFSGISCCAIGAYVESEVIVAFIDGTTRARAEQIAGSLGTLVLSFHNSSSVWSLMGVPAGRELEYATLFKGFGDVRFAHPNFLGCYEDPPCTCCQPGAVCPGLLPCAGAIPDGYFPVGGALTLDRLPGGTLELSWSSSCMPTDNDYEVYEGTLGDFGNHVPLLCSTNGANAAAITPGGGDTYYLVVPRNRLAEGSFGTNSFGGERSPGPAPCLPQAILPDCDPAPPCGDGVRQGFEQCDGSDLGAKTCADRGFHEGTLACGPSCSFNTSGCTGTCGDQIRGGNETCDGSDLGGADCVSQSFDGGDLACDASCAFDFTGCTSVCGDGIRRGFEQCDGSDLGGETCEDRGLPGGTLGCNGYCLYDVRACEGACGDRVRTGSEVCDGPDVGAGSCAGLGFQSGILACNATCDAFDTSGCWRCGNNVREAFEACDGLDLGGQTCNSQGYPFGTLSCNSTCNGFDYSLCTGF